MFCELLHTRLRWSIVALYARIPANMPGSHGPLVRTHVPGMCIVAHSIEQTPIAALYVPLLDSQPKFQSRYKPSPLYKNRGTLEMALPLEM